jgi:hypothetical protein
MKRFRDRDEYINDGWEKVGLENGLEWWGVWGLGLFCREKL